VRSGKEADLHLYLHIPFCHHICPYCGFYKHKPGRLANAEFVDAILAEAVKRSEGQRLSPATVYFGGGTPTLLSTALLERLIGGLHDVFDLSGVSEWTVEANPATFDLKKAIRIRELGPDRISLGIQSFQAEVLKTLGRDHSPADAIDAYQTLREAGFENISIDLMFSIPGQTRAHWQSDLEQAVALGPDHFSAYNLTYEEDTDFLTRHQSGELDASEDRDADLFYQAIDFLEAAGYRHYEISNYARPGSESQHNQAYWAGADYLGLGPGAVSTLNGQRWKTLPDTAAYVRASQSGLDTRTDIEILTDEDRRIESIAMQLRTAKGIPTGLLPTPNPLESLIQQGLVEERDGSIFLTRAGKALADPIAAELV
jgi:oxygen-independent coproporphyrinogen III oxidase